MAATRLKLQTLHLLRRTGKGLLAVVDRIFDEPISFPASVTGSQAWEPKNYDGKYEGPMSMRTALAKSKNMVSIRLLQASGVNFIQDYATRFGFDADKHPPYLTMALGAGSVTPWQMVTAYAVFANGGYRVQPFVVHQILDEKGQVLAQAQPVTAGDETLLALDPRNAYLMDSMLRGVTIYGTAARASATLKRHDLAGKTAQPMIRLMPGSVAIRGQS